MDFIFDYMKNFPPLPYIGLSGEEAVYFLIFFGFIYPFIIKTLFISTSCCNSENSKNSNSKISKPSLSMQVNDSYSYPKHLPDDLKTAFLDVFEVLNNDLVNELDQFNLIQESSDWIKYMCEYNVPNGKLNRGLSVVKVQEVIAKAQGKEFTTKDLFRACVLGWCVEWLQAFFLVADDLMDDSVTRRGQPCWFRREDVQVIAVNDSFILESHVFRLLKIHFGNEPYYQELVDLFHEVIYKTEIGQLLDLTSAPIDGEPDLDRFTEERYHLIVEYKTAYYSFYLPVALGMVLAGIKNKKSYQQASDILVKMGTYFQVQDDYLDCYGDPEVIGKIGTDIQDNKCGWLVVQALKLVNKRQRKTLENNYGIDQKRKINAVKKLYNSLGLEDIFHEYEEESYKEIKQLISEVKDVPHEVYEFLLKKIYKRSK